MPVREGGSYAVDPKTGANELIERTKPVEHAPAVQAPAPTEPAPETPALPAPEPAGPEPLPDAEQPGKPRKSKEA